MAQNRGEQLSNLLVDFIYLLWNLLGWQSDFECVGGFTKEFLDTQQRLSSLLIAWVYINYFALYVNKRKEDLEIMDNTFLARMKSLLLFWSMIESEIRRFFLCMFDVFSSYFLGHDNVNGTEGTSSSLLNKNSIWMHDPISCNNFCDDDLLMYHISSVMTIFWHRRM
jgi:hypothetical protein